jgi:hypothetical protein
VETNDIRTVVSCIDDIALGDAAEEGIIFLQKLANAY